MKVINLFVFKVLNFEGVCESFYLLKLFFYNWIDICLLGGEIKVKIVYKNNQNDKIRIESIFIMWFKF